MSVNYQRGRLTASTQATYYGEWTDFGGVPSADQTGGAEVLIDAELGYQLTDRIQLTVGAENLFDDYPDREARVSQTNNGIQYLRFAPTGFNGGFWYIRAKAEF